MNIRIIRSSFLTAITAAVAVFFIGCKKEDNNQQSNGVAEVFVNISGAEFDFEDSGNQLKSSVTKRSSSLVPQSELAENTFTIPFSDGIVAFGTLEDVSKSGTSSRDNGESAGALKSSSKAVIRRNPLTTGTRYILNVYNTSGALVAERSYIYGREGETLALLLDGGSTYDFIALSFNSQTTNPTVAYTNNVRTLANASVSTTNQDLMAFKQRIVVNGGQNNLSVILRHLFTEVTTNLIIDPSIGGNITSATSSTLRPVRATASYSLSTEAITYGTTSTNGASVTFATIPSGGSKQVSSSPVLFRTPNVTNGSLVIPSLTINGTTRSDFTVSDLVFAPGKKYNLNLNFRVPCTQTVNSELFSVSDGQTRTFTAPPANYGFVLDIYTLDNSFNMTINGTQLANSEIQFQSGVANYPRNIQFSDGAIWGDGTVPQIYSMTGTQANPLIRITISQTGQVSLQGSKTSGGPLFALTPISGQNLTFQNINWNTTSNNSITITQVVTGATYVTGRGQGRQIITCPN